MRVKAQAHVNAPPDAVWEIISDPTQMLNFMSGITRWEVAGEEATGLGARYRMLFRVGRAAPAAWRADLLRSTDPCRIGIK